MSTVGSPTGSPIIGGTYDMDDADNVSSTGMTNRINWERKRDQVKKALEEKCSAIEETLTGMEVKSLMLLKLELQKLVEFYSFLIVSLLLRSRPLISIV